MSLTHYYRLVRVTHDTTVHKRREGNRKTLRVGGRIKKELLWESDVRLADEPQLEFFISLDLLVEGDDDTTHEVDVLDAIEGGDCPVYTYEIEVRVSQRSEKWHLHEVLGCVSSNAEPLEELECDNSTQEFVSTDGPWRITMANQ